MGRKRENDLEEIGFEVLEVKSFKGDAKDIKIDHSNDVLEEEREEVKIDNSTVTNHNSSNTSLIIIGILLVCGVVFLFFVLFGLLIGSSFFIFNKTSDNVIEKLEEVKDKGIEVGIDVGVPTLKSEDEIKKDLSLKIDTLLYPGIYVDANDSVAYNALYFRNALLKRDITEEEKQNIIVRSIHFNPISNDNWKNTNTMKKMVDEDPRGEDEALKEYGELSLDIVNDNYKSLFGSNMTPIGSLKGCPNYEYCSKTKTYYRLEPRCGGLNPNYYVSYKYNYINDKDNGLYYVDVAIGFVEMSGNINDDSYKLYSDYKIEGSDITASATPLNLIKESQTGASNHEYDINKTNYNNFSSYRFTFEKDNDDNYYFVSVKQTK